MSKDEDGLALSHEDLVAQSLILLFAGKSTF
jgi:cytochrome P450